MSVCLTHEQLVAHGKRIGTYEGNDVYRLGNRCYAVEDGNVFPVPLAEVEPDDIHAIGPGQCDRMWDDAVRHF